MWTTVPVPDRAPHTAYLVGAGPGDPELLTLKAVRVLQAATVILVDDLVGEQVLAIVAWVEDSWPDWVDALSDWAGAAWEWSAEEALPRAVDALGDWGAALIDWAAASWPQWAEALKASANRLLCLSPFTLAG